jgi:dTDP-4-dehydrorhamnose 3,5-epimerase
MHITPLAIPDVLLIQPKQLADERGFFSEVYNQRALVAAGVDLVFVQDNHARSIAAGTVRGLHYQTPPTAQAKLVRVSRGRIFDVAVDLRRDFATFGRHVTVELSAENWSQLLVPAGFAHGYCTLEPDTEVLYKVTTHFAPADEAGVLWNDPDLGIGWPIAAEKAVLSGKDLKLPRLMDIVSPF